MPDEVMYLATGGFLDQDVTGWVRDAALQYIGVVRSDFIPTVFGSLGSLFTVSILSAAQCLGRGACKAWCR